MPKSNPFKYFKTSHEIIRLAVMYYVPSFTSIHLQIYNHFNHQRHLQKRAIFKQQRSESLSEWRGLFVA